MLIINNLHFFFKDKQLFEGLDFELEKNKFIGLIGKNGTGKTTFLKILLGLVENFSGVRELNLPDVLEQNVFGALIENPPYFDFMTVRENLEYKRVLLGLEKIAVQEAIMNCALDEYEHKIARNLSLGYKQKLGIALAIINKPAILILDEPTNSIDTETSIEIINLIKKYQKSYKKSVLMVSHDLKKIEDYCDSIFEIKNKKIYAL